MGSRHSPIRTLYRQPSRACRATDEHGRNTDQNFRLYIRSVFAPCFIRGLLSAVKDRLEMGPATLSTHGIYRRVREPLDSPRASQDAYVGAAIG